MLEEEKDKNLIKEIKIIEEKVFRNNDISNHINYYKFLEKNELLFFKIYKTLSNSKNNKTNKIKNKLYKKIENKVNIDDFIIIKSHKDLINFLISLIILKNFTKQSIYDNKNEESLKHMYKFNNNLSSNFEKFLIFIEIILKVNIDLNFDQIFDFMIENIYILVDSGIVKKEIFIKKNKKKNFIYIEKISYDNSIILSHEKYKIYEKNGISYLYSNHFYFINKIFKKNIKSNYSFMTNINSKFFENILSSGFYISKKMLEKTYLELLKENNKNSEEIEKEYEILIEKCINFIKNKDMSSLSLISKKISKIQNLVKIKKILELDFENKEIFVPFSFDFRGRLYYDSEISISYYKEFRFCLNLGKYEKIETNYNPFNDTINNELKKYFYKIKEIKGFKLTRKKEEIKISIIWLLVSLGEINKSNIGKEVHVLKFIEEGLKILNKEINTENFDVFDRIKINYITNILEELEKNIYVKWLISKDATASVYQHLVKTCGHANQDVLKWCNLDSKDTWYDTYSYIIDEFKKNNKLEEEISNIFVRKNLKKIMMTENYSASYRTCKKYFIENIKLEEYNENTKDKIIKNFSIFYEYISNNKKMFETDLSKILDYFEKNDYILYLNNESKDIIIFKYYKGSTKQKEIKINNTRYTYQKWNLNKEKLDINKIKSSIKANYIHTIDAALVRWIISQNKIKAVHDCFYIDFLNLTYLTSLINEGMRIEFHNIEEIKKKNIFSIFIVI